MTGGRVTVAVPSAPASYGQEEMWLFEQASPGRAVYHLPVLYDLLGALDVTALRLALDLLVVRHEALRTRLRYGESGLLQWIDPDAPVELAVHDLGALPTVDRSGQADTLIAEFVRRPFALADEPPLRAMLLRRTDHRHMLALLLHHVACDGWSFALLREELGAAYRAYAAGKTPVLPPTGAPYREVAIRQRATGGNRRVHSGWTSCSPPALPTDGTRADRQGQRGGTMFDALPPPAVDRLAEYASGRGTTLYAVLLALFGWLLGRWSGQSELLVTTPLATRPTADLERTVGFLVTTLPVPIDLNGARNLTTLVDRVHGTLVDAYDADRSSPSPRLAGHVSFTLEHSDGAGIDWGTVRGRERFVHTGTARFDLAVRVVRAPKSCVVHAEYDSDLFRASTVRRLLGHLGEVVEAAAAPGRESCGSWPSAPAPDRAAARRLGRGPRRRVPASVPRRIATAARTDEVAVRDARHRIDHATLWRAAGAFGGRLVDLGAGPGALVAICLPASVELLVAVVGILRAGAGYVPLDPRDPPARRAAMLTRAGVRALVADAAVDCADWPGMVVSVPLGAAADCRLPGDRPHPAALAYVTHTSGSTGPPKGVLVTHGGLANYLDWAVGAYGLAPGGEVPLHTPVAYDLAVTSLLGPLVAGGRIHAIPASADQHTTVSANLAGYQLVKATPTHLEVLIDQASRPGAARGGRSGTAGPSVVVVGGENLGAAQARRFRAALPAARIFNEYGPTETVVGSTFWELSRSSQPTGFVPIGRPIANTTVSVVDAELRPLPVGVWGEMVVGGAGVSRGYLGQPALTAERFPPDANSARPGGRLYRTGDIARFTADGQLVLRGRIDDQVKVLGYRVEPGEIEAVLATVPGVRQAAVRIDGGPSRRIVGYVRTIEKSTVDVSATVLAHLRAHLPAHMVPDAIVVVDHLPVTANGKLDRAALPDPPTPPTAPPATVAHAPTPTHQAVHDAWCAVLGVGRVGFDISFFDAGGTSLQLLKLERELAARGVAVSVTDLFRHPTIASLAGQVLGRGANDAEKADATDRQAAREARRDRLRSRRGLS